MSNPQLLQEPSMWNFKWKLTQIFFFKKNLLNLINEGQNTRQILYSCVQCQNNFLILLYQNPHGVFPLFVSISSILRGGKQEL